MPVVAASLQPQSHHTAVAAADGDACPRSQTMARLERGSLLVRGREILARAPPNVALRPAVAPGAAFLGATASAPSSRHVFSLGALASLQVTE
ncbi:hypothetical protein ABZP36_008040 [Zizania latifolia]